jgi:hypothetical protein
MKDTYILTLKQEITPNGDTIFLYIQYALPYFEYIDVYVYAWLRAKCVSSNIILDVIIFIASMSIITAEIQKTLFIK